MSYKKIGPGHPEWPLVRAAKDAGRWVCGAVSHNSYRGCENPACWKHQPNRLKRKPR